MNFSAKRIVISKRKQKDEDHTGEDVRYCMDKTFPCFKSTTCIEDALSTFAKSNFQYGLVLSASNQVLGKVGDLDCLHSLRIRKYSNWKPCNVEDLMQPIETFLKPGQKWDEALKVIDVTKQTFLPVLTDEKLIGVVTRKKILEKLKQKKFKLW